MNAVGQQIFIMSDGLRGKRQRYRNVNHESTLNRPFENCWSRVLRKPDYDALNDPHTSSYFKNNNNMKKHLLGLHKSINLTGKHAEKKKISCYINQMIAGSEAMPAQEYYKKFKASKSNSSLLSKSSNQQSRKTLHKPGLTHKKNKTIDLSIKVGHDRSKKSMRLPAVSGRGGKAGEKVSLEQKIKSENEKGHLKLLKFLQEKKRKLATEDC